jgi:hypothetical protein
MVFAHSVFAQGKGALESLNYIKINNYDSPIINISLVNDFIELIDSSKTRNVFVTDGLFLIQGQSIMYTLNANGYKNILDLKNGSDKNFNDGESYYYALENNLQNQTEVDYYKSEGFITNADYHEAVRLGFIHRQISKKGIYGLVTREYIQKNLKYLNYIYYLRSYKNWQAAEDELADQDQTRTNSVSSTRRYINPDATAKGQREQRAKKEQEGMSFLQNSDIDLIIDKLNIQKLNFFNYYLVNVALEPDKDSVFFYICKFCGFSNANEFAKNTSEYSITTTDKIIKQLSFNSLNDMLDADIANVPNGNDYYLMRSYFITLEELNQNKTFISELEDVKLKYLSTIDLAISRESFRANEINRVYDRKSDAKSIYAFIIYALLEQKKGEPITYDNFIRNVQDKYGNNPLYRYLNFDKYKIANVFNIDKIKDLFVTNNDAFYLK